MHTLTLSSSLALALGALTTNARKTASPPKINEPPPFYDWEHRTICKQDLLNPRRQSLEEPLNFEVMVVGYAWDETNALQPDHRWNWNSTANANRKIQDHLNYSGMIVSDGKNEYLHNENYVFSSGKPDDRGCTQFTVEFIIGQKYNPIAEALNMALGIEGCECDDNAYGDCECDDDNPYTSIVCLDQETSLPESEGGPRPHYPSHEEMRYVQAEDEMLLQRQRFQQLHEDRVKATDEELAKSDRFIQEHAGKAPKKTLEMEESDRRIQAMAHGLPPRDVGDSIA